jgi:disulfide bond formation protein DsbB
VTISDKNRKWFEGIGLDKIRLEITVGNQYYIPVDAAAQAEAREWVAEQDAKREQEKREARQREVKTLGWTIAGVLVAIVAACAAVIAAWPVIREWLR